MLPPTGQPPPHKIILFELDFNVKFPLLRLLLFWKENSKTAPIHIIQGVSKKAFKDF